MKIEWYKAKSDLTFSYDKYIAVIRKYNLWIPINEYSKEKINTILKNKEMWDYYRHDLDFDIKLYYRNITKTVDLKEKLNET